MSLAGGYQQLGDTDKALQYFEEAKALFREQNDAYGVADVYSRLIDLFTLLGDWRAWFNARAEGLRNLPDEAKNSSVYAELIGGGGLALSAAGRYAESEANAHAAYAVHKQLGEADVLLSAVFRDLG